jgi:hypothetical protein
MVFKDKQCKDCGRIYTPISGNQKYCLDCGKKRYLEAQRKYSQMIREAKLQGKELLPYCQNCRKRTLRATVRETKDLAREICLECGEGTYLLESGLDGKI